MQIISFELRTGRISFYTLPKAARAMHNREYNIISALSMIRGTDFTSHSGEV